MEYLYPGGLAKAITFSYDDGQVYDRRLIEIFNQAGFKGTFHLTSGNLDMCKRPSCLPCMPSTKLPAMA